MKGRMTVKGNWREFLKFERLFLSQKQFPPLPNPYEDKIQPIKHSGYLMFVRSKFLFLGFKKSIEEKNLFAAYTLLKAYWENVATFGYYFLTISDFLTKGDKEEAFILSRKIAMGGRGFPTEEMANNKGLASEDFKIPRISKMIDKVDKDLGSKLGKDASMIKDLYGAQVAEGGHTTYTGLWISGKRLSDGSALADLHKSWSKSEQSSLINLVVMASLIFFHYWDRFEKING